MKYGSARDHVIGVLAVLADGEALELGREPWSMAAARRHST